MYTVDDGNIIIKNIAKKLIKDVDLFAELDGLSGDGDLGETMGKCAGVLLEISSAGEYANFGELFSKMAMAVNKAAPSTLGTLLSGGILNAAKTFQQKEILSGEDAVKIPLLIAEGIQKRGKAQLGDKTILDALIPMGEAAVQNYSLTGDIKQGFKAGGIAAREGAQSTCGMIPKAGRAQWIGERVKDNMDGGAAVCASVAELFV